MGALRGVRVVDLARVLAGPYATMLLGDLGAEVIKIERAGTGDETRAWAPPVGPDGASTYFSAVNRNKTARTADLGDPDDIAALQALIADADVLVENARPGTMDRVGLGYDAMQALNPRLVYCSISGFGTRAGAALPGFDLLVQATGGLMSITGESEPMKAGVALVDVITGLHAVTGILAALHAREHTGRGQHVEVDLLSSLLSALTNQASAHLLAGVEPVRLGNAHPSIAPYEVVHAADRPFVVAAGTDAQFRSLVDELGAPGLGDDERFRTNAQRVSHRGELLDALHERLKAHTADEWVDALTRRGVPAGRINTIPEAFAFAQALGLEPVVEIDGMRQVASPLHLSDTPVEYRSAPPVLGPRVSQVRPSATRPDPEES